MTEVPPDGPSSIDPRSAKAEAAAAKARAKAVRPWFKKKRVIIPAAIVLIVIASRVGGGDSEPSPAASGSSGGGQAEQAAPEASTGSGVGIGQAAEDGDFSFVVDSFECIGSVVKSTNDFLDDAEAQGEWCVLSITVTNTGDSAGTLFASNQYLVDNQEREFAASDSFEVYLLDETPIFEQINPGNSLSGRIYFDVSDPSAIVEAELHDSAFSGGVRVVLR